MRKFLTSQLSELEPTPLSGWQFPEPDFKGSISQSRHRDKGDHFYWLGVIRPSERTYILASEPLA